MKSLCFITAVLLLFSCTIPSPDKKQLVGDESPKSGLPVSYTQIADSIGRQISQEDAEHEIDTFYVVQVAEGKDYDSLQRISHAVARRLASRFDMLDRVYRINKGIVVPESSDDEIYRGSYYPRRPFEDQNFVSIEMSTAFVREATDTLQMMVLANICRTRSGADSVVALLQKDFDNGKAFKSVLFLGCMH